MKNTLMFLFAILAFSSCTQVIGTQPIASDVNKYPFRILEVSPNPLPLSENEYIIFKNVSSQEQTSSKGWYAVVQSSKRVIKLSALFGRESLAANATRKNSFSNVSGTDWFKNSDTLKLYDSLNTLVQSAAWINAKVDEKITF